MLIFFHLSLHVIDTLLPCIKSNGGVTCYFFKTFLGTTKPLNKWVCPLVGWSVTRSFDDPNVAPFWPTLPCLFLGRTNHSSKLTGYILWVDVQKMWPKRSSNGGVDTSVIDALSKFQWLDELAVGIEKVLEFLLDHGSFARAQRPHFAR